MNQSAQNEHADHDSNRHHEEKRAEHGRDKDPIASARLFRSPIMALKQFVVPRIRFEPEGEGVANSRNDAHDFVDENVQRHAREGNARDAAARGVDQTARGNKRGSHITETRNQTDDWVEAEFKMRARKGDEIVHDVREPFEERLEAGLLLLLLRRQDFEFDFLRFHRQVENLIPLSPIANLMEAMLITHAERTPQRGVPTIHPWRPF